MSALSRSSAKTAPGRFSARRELKAFLAVGVRRMLRSSPAVVTALLSRGSPDLDLDPRRLPDPEGFGPSFPLSSCLAPHPLPVHLGLGSQGHRRGSRWAGGSWALTPSLLLARPCLCPVPGAPVPPTRRCAEPCPHLLAQSWLGFLRPGLASPPSLPLGAAMSPPPAV